MQPPPAPERFETRAFTPIRNPVYVHNDDDSFKTRRQPVHALERPPALPPGVDPRLTSEGSRPPVAGLPAPVPMAGQTPYNVWALWPQ